MIFKRMRISRLVIVSFWISGCSVSTSILDNQSKENMHQHVEINLKVDNETVSIGEFPKLVVEITNRENSILRILDFGRRIDLQRSYSKIRIGKGRKRLRLPQGITDPGSFADNPYLDLPPNETLSINLAPPPIDLSSLKPGKYWVFIKILVNPENEDIRWIESEKVYFKVKK